jgi:hypothetical protein
MCTATGRRGASQIYSDTAIATTAGLLLRTTLFRLKVTFGGEPLTLAYSCNKATTQPIRKRVLKSGE